jgi:hypothetical protein
VPSVRSTESRGCGELSPLREHDRRSVSHGSHATSASLFDAGVELGNSR